MADFLISPELIWLPDGRCYRKLPINYPDRNYDENENEEPTLAYEDEELAEGCAAAELVTVDPIEPGDVGEDGPSCEGAVKGDGPPPGFEEGANGSDEKVTADWRYGTIVKKGDSWVCRVVIPSTFHRFIVGRGAETRRKLERETRCRVIVPRPQEPENTPVEIFGSHRLHLQVCREKILMLTNSARIHLDPTHFISIPITNDHIRDSTAEFKRNVLETCRQSRGVDASVFQASEQLHLTVGMLTLLSDDERKCARDVLIKIVKQHISPLLSSSAGDGLKVRVHGLEFMNDDPSEVDVLYAKIVDEPSDVAPTGLLQQIANKMATQMVKKTDLMPRHQDSVKLHITLMNSRFREEPQRKEGGGDEDSRSGGDRRRPRISFDATEIMRRYGDYDFGVVHVKQVHISQRFAGCDGNGYYKASAVIDL